MSARSDAPPGESSPRGPRRVRVAVLLGGPSPEREVSWWSGTRVIAALDPREFDVLPIEITTEGHWLPRPDLLRLPAASGASPAAQPAPASGTSLVHEARQIGDVVGGGAIDVAFIAMHGPYGEDGTIQGMLELLGIPYTGSGVLASALAMDKLRSRQVLQANGIPVPAYLPVERDRWAADRAAIAARVGRDLGYPCVVKPNAVGSSIGVAIARDEAALAAAVGDALGYGELVLIEEYLRGTELTCAIIDDPATGEAHALPLIEIVPHREFFTYEAKYVPGASDELVPARIPAAAAERAQAIALRVHRVIGCEGFSRVDMFFAAGNIIVLEANTIPGLSEGSLIPRAARAAGIEFPDLLRRVIASARRRAYTRRTPGR